MIDDRVKTVVEFVYDHDWHDRSRGYPDSARKAFVRVAGYNSGLTDVPGLYLAHTWKGLRRYMAKVGLLPKLELAKV